MMVTQNTFVRNAKGGWNVWRKLQRIWKTLEVRLAPATISWVHAGEGSSSEPKRPAVQWVYLLTQLKADPLPKDVSHREGWTLLKVRNTF